MVLPGLVPAGRSRELPWRIEVRGCSLEIRTGFGFSGFYFFGSVSKDSVATLYVFVYLPLRIFEWSLIGIILTRGDPTLRIAVRNPKLWLWVAGGVAVSFTSDLLSPEYITDKFCVGRCMG
jgi:hypothetical protein